MPIFREHSLASEPGWELLVWTSFVDREAQSAAFLDRLAPIVDRDEYGRAHLLGCILWQGSSENMPDVICSDLPTALRHLLTPARRSRRGASPSMCREDALEYSDYYPWGIMPITPPEAAGEVARLVRRATPEEFRRNRALTPAERLARAWALSEAERALAGPPL